MEYAPTFLGSMGDKDFPLSSWLHQRSSTSEKQSSNPAYSVRTSEYHQWEVSGHTPQSPIQKKTYHDLDLPSTPRILNQSLQTLQSCMDEIQKPSHQLLIPTKLAHPDQKPQKPLYSYIYLIAMAISSHPDRRANLQEIIAYIEDKFPFYQTHSRWHASIRHNLTLNDCFVKTEKRPGDKGFPWAIDPSFQDMFDSGSLRRRRYRFKEGTKKWHSSREESRKKSLKQKAAKAARAHAAKSKDNTSSSTPSRPVYPESHQPPHQSCYQNIESSPQTSGSVMSYQDVTSQPTSCTNSLPTAFSTPAAGSGFQGNPDCNPPVPDPLPSHELHWSSGSSLISPVPHPEQPQLYRFDSTVSSPDCHPVPSRSGDSVFYSYYGDHGDPNRDPSTPSSGYGSSFLSQCDYHTASASAHPVSSYSAVTYDPPSDLVTCPSSQLYSSFQSDYVFSC